MTAIGRLASLEKASFDDAKDAAQVTFTKPSQF